MLTQDNPTNTSGIQTQHTWEVWNVTKEDDEFLVMEGLTKDEAEEVAEQFTQDPSKKYFDEEKGVEMNAEYEAKDGGTPMTQTAGPVTDLTPDSGPLSKEL